MAQQDNTPGDGWEIDDNLDDVQTRVDIVSGRWLMKIATMEKKWSRDNTKEFFNIAFEVRDVLDVKDEGVIGAKTWDIFNLNKEALWKLKALISACGYDATGSRVPNLVGCEVVLDTYEEEYQGNRQMKTKRYKNPLVEGWTGIHETRDATDDGKGKVDDEKKKPENKKPGALGGKKLASGAKKPDDEVEI